MQLNSVGIFNRLVEQIYCPPRYPSGWSIEKFLGVGEVRYFSFGRYALRDALNVSGIRKGDGVLLPAFICRDLLAAIHSLGAIPLFYAVGNDLGMTDDPDDLQIARAIIAVNYFGFPQDLTPFKSYCNRTGAVLVEDNAHGLLSRDESGRQLGTRGDLGIFSLRKTVPLLNGAVLFLNPSVENIKLNPQEPFTRQYLPWSFRIKQLLRKLSPIMGWKVARLFTSLGRRFRKIRTGHEIIPSPSDAEFRMPGNASPCKELKESLASVDVDGEIRRRRELYMALEDKIISAGGEPVFEQLPSLVVPYVFPFFASEEQAASVNRALGKLGLECHPWPELPDAIISQAPEHYKRIWMVNFLW